MGWQEGHLAVFLPLTNFSSAAPIQGLRSAELGVRAIESIYATVTEHSALVANNYHSYRPFNHHASLGLCLICHGVPLPFYRYNIQLTSQLKLNYLLFVITLENHTMAL